MIDNTTGTLYVVAAPSGGGKTSLVSRLIESLDDIEISVSHTTRLQRPNEREGKDYFFVDEKCFMEMVNNQEFIEHARVFDHYYGTAVSQIETKLARGKDIILDIDWQGAIQLRKLYKYIISIFIIPPSIEALLSRLQHRAQDDDSVIAARMEKAKSEIAHYPEFDYLIVNDDFDEAAIELQSIILSNRLLMQKQVIKHEKLLSILLKK